MLNFPIPYYDELIYSVIARSGTRKGFTSPKQLLDEVFHNRHVIATIDLPNHLNQIVSHYPLSLKLDLLKIIYSHTLFPIYAPFVIESKRQQCIERMANMTHGSIHLGLGVNASRIKRLSVFRYCPKCLEQQREKHGEYYWLRQWQINGVDCCAVHHLELIPTEISLHALNRHAFIQATPTLCLPKQQAPSDKLHERIVQQINILLHRDPAESASLEQWSLFYAQLAQRVGCKNQRSLSYSELKSKILKIWPQKFLSQYGLKVTDSQTCWLRSIFRKHRKSFSYLEHLIVLDALLPRDWSIAEVLTEISTLRKMVFAQVKHKKPILLNKDLLRKNRISWIALIKSDGVQVGRQQGENGKALYAWLYRNDKKWLLKTNLIYHQSSHSNNCHTNWVQRDQLIYHQLLTINESKTSDLNDPRRSRNWYLSHLQQAGTIEKNLHKLPLTLKFLGCFSESIPLYQIRRIQNAIKQLENDNRSKTRWRVLRSAGLSEERLTEEAAHYLHQDLTIT